MFRIALIGDYSPSVIAHRAIPIALRMAVERLQADVSWEWIHTRTLGNEADAVLDTYTAVWCVPASPYENTTGAVRAIRFARTTGRPFLGTCGGFQHALLEYAQAVWGIEAAHAETDPRAQDPVISPLSCSLVEVQGELRFTPGSQLARIYGREQAVEGYHCNYGLNPRYVHRLGAGPLKIAARDIDGDVRAVELTGHPFFIATLFQPERAALHGQLPPLVHALVAATVQEAHGASG
jgi:CTP synthase (UTP-ammonia lyase)